MGTRKNQLIDFPYRLTLSFFFPVCMLSARAACGPCAERDRAMLHDVSCRATGLRCFKICHSAELNKLVEAKAPVNPFDNLPQCGGRTERGYEHITSTGSSSQVGCSKLTTSLVKVSLNFRT